LHVFGPSSPGPDARHCCAADDDYFDNFDDGEGNGDGDGFFRAVLAQLYDEASINAVMQEWFRTVADLPLIIRQAVSMGLFSSAQLVRFLSMDVRPSVTRAVTRAMPPQVRPRLLSVTPTRVCKPCVVLRWCLGQQGRSRAVEASWAGSAAVQRQSVSERDVHFPEQARARGCPAAC